MSRFGSSPQPRHKFFGVMNGGSRSLIVNARLDDVRIVSFLMYVRRALPVMTCGMPWIR